jgi:Lon protease-like protein
VSEAAFDFAPPPPEELAVFPLSGALLLPRGRLPLNIFENRYLNMVGDAMAAGRMIGMIQPAERQPHIVEGNCPLFDVGCIGRITQFAETGDGRIMMTLLGVGRFRIDRELSDRNGYRRVQADYAGFSVDIDDDISTIADRPRLLKAVNAFFSARGVDSDMAGIDKASDEYLVNALAMASPFSPEEKQALLESADLQDRAAMLTALFEMALSSGPGGATPDNQARH